MKKFNIYIRQCLPGIFILLACHSNAQDWPQYLGPERNSTSPQKGLLRSWPEKGPEVLWTVPLGIGFGGPVVKDGRVYLLDRDDQFGDYMRCFDLESGEELWKFGYEAPGTVSFPGSRTVPLVDGDYVYSCGPYGDLYCIDINSHEPVWNTNIWSGFGGEEIPKWAISQCPLVYGDLLILASQAPKAGVVAFRKRTGELEWATDSLGRTGYVSPALVKIDGREHVVMITASARNGSSPGNVLGINPETGEILWKYEGWNCQIPIPSAVDAGENRVLILGGYALGATMIKVEKGSDGAYRTRELFTTAEFGDQTKPAILHGGYFYAQYSTNSRRDGLTCMNMDGEILWNTKTDPGFNKGSMILADGLLLATDGASTLYLIDPDPTGFRPLASAPILAPDPAPEGQSSGGSNKQNWAPIALADGRLLIRNQSLLMCVRVAE